MVAWGPHDLTLPNSSSSPLSPPITQYTPATWADHLPGLCSCSPPAWITLSLSLHLMMPSHPTDFNLKVTSFGKALSPCYNPPPQPGQDYIRAHFVNSHNALHFSFCSTYLNRH